jgi:hypothetical protein
MILKKEIVLEIKLIKTLCDGNLQNLCAIVLPPFYKRLLLFV